MVGPARNPWGGQVGFLRKPSMTHDRVAPVSDDLSHSLTGPFTLDLVAQ